MTDEHRGTGPARTPPDDAPEPGPWGEPPPEPPPGPPPGESSAASEPLPPERRAPSWVAPFLVAGFLVYPLVVGLLWWTTPLAPWDALFVGFLVELLPVLAVAQVPMAESAVAEGAVLERIPVYVTSAAVILFLGWMAFVLGAGPDEPRLLGLVLLPAGPLLLWAGGLTLAALLLLAGFAVLGRALGRPESAVLRALIPRTPAEKGTFMGLSAAAGVGEELAYRSYAIPALALVVGSPWAAAVLSSVVFGFLHAYQGILGTCRAALLGFVLAVSLLVTGSVLPAVLAHAAIDVVAGLFLGDRLLDRGG